MLLNVVGRVLRIQAYWRDRNLREVGGHLMQRERGGEFKQDMSVEDRTLRESGAQGKTYELLEMLRQQREKTARALHHADQLQADRDGAVEEACQLRAQIDEIRARASLMETRCELTSLRESAKLEEIEQSERLRYLAPVLN